jgi:hypothetical protein
MCKRSLLIKSDKHRVILVFLVSLDVRVPYFLKAVNQKSYMKKYAQCFTKI